MLFVTGQSCWISSGIGGGYVENDCSVVFFIQIIGKFVTSSGLEDNIFQSGMMNSECIKGVLSESDYKHVWLAHNVTSKALERLLLSRFLTKVSRANVFATRNAISRHISPMIKGVNYPFSLVIYFAIKSQSDS